MKRASPDDSMMFVRRNPKPMKVKKMNAVKATPSRVDDSGDEAAAGYDLNNHASLAYLIYGFEDTHNDNNPRRYDIRHSSRNEKSELIPFALTNQSLPRLPHLLHYQQA